MRAAAATLLVVLSAPGALAAFGVASGSVRPKALRRFAPRMSTPTPPDGDRSSDKGEYSVDWDTAWATELSRRQRGEAQWRPEGRDAVSSEQLQAARVTRSLGDAQGKLAALVDTSDWKFWVGLLAALSVLTALATHPSSDVYSI
jgi:hypothetical protein